MKYHVHVAALIVFTSVSLQAQSDPTIKKGDTGIVIAQQVGLAEELGVEVKVLPVMRLTVQEPSCKTKVVYSENWRNEPDGGKTWECVGAQCPKHGIVAPSPNKKPIPSSRRKMTTVDVEEFLMKEGLDGGDAGFDSFNANNGVWIKPNVPAVKSKPVVPVETLNPISQSQGEPEFVLYVSKKEYDEIQKLIRSGGKVDFSKYDHYGVLDSVAGHVCKYAVVFKVDPSTSKNNSTSAANKPESSGKLAQDSKCTRPLLNNGFQVEDPTGSLDGLPLRCAFGVGEAVVDPQDCTAECGHYRPELSEFCCLGPQTAAACSQCVEEKKKAKKPSTKIECDTCGVK